MNFAINIGYSAFYNLLSESFPTRIRGSGVGFVGVLNRIGGISAPIITGFVLDQKNGFFIVSSAYMLCFLVASKGILFVKETKIKKISKILIE
jgi:nitrate/nitrite transporter NarK